MAAPGNSSEITVTLFDEAISAPTLQQVGDTFFREGIRISPWEELIHQNQVHCLKSTFDWTVFAQKQERPTQQTLKLLRRKLLTLLPHLKADLALQVNDRSRTKKLVIFDMDSTLIQNEVIDELAREKNVYEEVSQITQRAMAGELDFDESLKLRVKKLAGLPLNSLESVYARLVVTPGASELIQSLKKNNCQTAIISGGFTFFAELLKEKLQIDFAFANHLEVSEGKITGRVIPPILNAAAKAARLEALAEQLGLQLDEVVAVGDGANDLPMIRKAGLGIAFHAKTLVQAEADFSYNQPSMQPLIFLF